MKVYLKSDLDEVFLGTVEEIITNKSARGSGIGMSFEAIISDIVADMLYDPNSGSQRTLTITLR